VRDGIAGTQYEGELRDLQFSPDSRHMAFLAPRNGKYVLDLDGQPGAEHASIFSLTFTPTSKTLIVCTDNTGKMLTVVDGVTLLERDAGGAPTFSADGTHMAYPMYITSNIAIVVDGQQGILYDRVSEGPLFSSDGTRCAYIAWNVPGQRTFVVMDGHAVECDNAGSVAFSPDSKHAVYSLFAGKKWHVVLDGKAEPDYDGIGNTTTRADGYRSSTGAFFSPDSQHVAYIAKKGSTAMAVVDHQPGEAYDEIEKLFFSADSKHVIYTARRSAQWCVVIDGKAGKLYGEIIKNGPAERGDGMLEYLAVKDGSLLRIRQPLTP
jgi:Tol biopolymer transport system component